MNLIKKTNRVKISCLFLVYVMSMKKTKQHNFQTTWTKVDLFLNLGHGLKKSKAKTQFVHNVNAKKCIKKYDNNITKSWQIYIAKISVEHIKNDVEFYLYLHPLDIWFKEFFQKISNLHVAHVHPCGD